MKQITERITKETGSEPSVEDIAAEMDITPARVERIMQYAQHPISVETPVGDEGDTTIGDFLTDTEETDPMAAVYEATLKAELDEALSTLTPRQARILKMRYGLGNTKPHTLSEIGEKFGLTRERIRHSKQKRWSGYGGRIAAANSQCSWPDFSIQRSIWAKQLARRNSQQQPSQCCPHRRHRPDRSIQQR